MKKSFFLLIIVVLCKVNVAQEFTDVIKKVYSNMQSDTLSLSFNSYTVDLKNTKELYATVNAQKVGEFGYTKTLEYEIFESSKEKVIIDYENKYVLCTVKNLTAKEYKLQTSSLIGVSDVDSLLQTSKLNIQLISKKDQVLHYKVLGELGGLKSLELWINGSTFMYEKVIYNYPEDDPYNEYLYKKVIVEFNFLKKSISFKSKIGISGVLIRKGKNYSLTEKYKNFELIIN